MDSGETLETVSIVGESTSRRESPLANPDPNTTAEAREHPEHFATEWVRAISLEQRTLFNRQNQNFNQTMTHVINLVEESRVQVGALTTKLIGLEDQVGSLLGQVGKLQENVQMSNLSNIGRGENVSFSNPIQTVVFAQQDNPPVFDPVKKFGSGRYLEELESYFLKRTIPEERKLEIAIEGLRGHAKNWASVCKATWTGFEDFKAGFQNYFWSVQDQGKLRQQISSGSCPKQTSLSEHFAYIASLANLLTSPIPEETLVEEIMQHFPTHIQALWSLKSKHNIGEALAFLKQQEVIGNGRERQQTIGGAKPRTSTPQKFGESGRSHPYNPYYKENAPRETHQYKYPIQVMQTTPDQGNAEQSS